MSAVPETAGVATGLAATWAATGLVAASFVLVGFSGALVSWADVPSTVLLVLRLLLPPRALSLVFWRRQAARPRCFVATSARLLLMGPLDGGSLLC